MRAAIDVLAAAPSPRWLVLGDMGEVGANGPAFHREVGAYARDAGIDRLLTVGALAAESAAAFGAGARAFRGGRGARRARRRDGAAPGTTVLVKGSRFMRMERVVAALVRPGRGGRGALMLLWLTELAREGRPRVQRLRLPHAARGAGVHDGALHLVHRRPAE